MKIFFGVVASFILSIVISIPIVTVMNAFQEHGRNIFELMMDMFYVPFIIFIIIASIFARKVTLNDANVSSMVQPAVKPLPLSDKIAIVIGLICLFLVLYVFLFTK